MSLWKKAVSTLATAGLLASLLGTAVAGTTLAATPLTGANGSLTCAVALDTSTCSQVANGFSYVDITVTPPSAASGLTWTTGDTVVLSINTPTFTSASGLTLSSDKLSASIDFTSGSTLGSVRVTAPAAPGTSTITVTDWAAPVNGYRAPTAWGSFTITWVSASSVLVSAANSSVNIYTAGQCAAASPTKATSQSYVAGTTGQAQVCVDVANGVNGAVSGATVTATISPVGNLHNGAYTGQTLVTTSAADGSAIFDIVSTGVAGVATITVQVTYGGTTTVLGSKTFTFYGPVASITAAAELPAIQYNHTTADAISFTAKDAAGNAVPLLASDVTAVVTGKVTAAAATDDSQPAATDANGYGSVTCGSTVGTGTVALKKGTVVSNAVTFTCSDVAKTIALAFDKAVVAPGGTAKIVLTGTDANGLPAWNTASLPLVVSTGALLKAAGTANGDGTVTWTWLAPFSTGTATAAVIGGTDFGTKYASITIGTVSAAATNASALGVTKVGPYTTATKIAMLGKYVTFKMDFGAASAGKTVEIWVAAKNSAGVWGGFSKLTSRVADANGVVYFYWKSASASWVSVRGKLDTVASNAVQARWR